MQFNFDARIIEPNTGGSGGDDIPTGTYHVMIDNIERKPVTDKPTCAYLEVSMVVLDPGPYKGLHVIDRLNMWNDSAKAQDIAHKTFSALCHVTGILVLQDTQQLYNIPFAVKIVQTEQPNPDNPNTPYKNTNVKKYMDVNENDAKHVGAGPQRSAPQPAAPTPAPQQAAWQQPTQAPVGNGAAAGSAWQQSPAGQVAQPQQAPVQQQPTGFVAGPPSFQQPVPQQQQLPVQTQAPVQSGWQAPAQQAPAAQAPWQK
jgi:hypothetical protein